MNLNGINIGLIGVKSGMSRIFNEKGKSIPVTVLKIEKNIITDVKTVQSDGYTSIQISSVFHKESMKNKISKTLRGFFQKINVDPCKFICEFRHKEILGSNSELVNKSLIGKEIEIDNLLKGKMVDIKGVTKGRGFSGTIKRWGFSSQPATHGNSLAHRVPGSCGQCQFPGRVFKNKKMAGRLGGVNRTVQNLKIISVDKNNSLLTVKGSIPGFVGSKVIILPAIKINNEKNNGIGE